MGEAVRNWPQTLSKTAYRKKLTWDQAKEFCNERESFLAVINSEEENNLVHEIATKAFAPEKRYLFWIGLRKCGSSWKWVDGAKANYTKWSLRQPDNYKNNEECVHMYVRIGESSKWTDRHWNDHHCSHKAYFVCQNYF
ncbi:C-type lectin domain-containing protein [Trichostrongylus colubriformis]|uniref:C-type lectin domain-containing protein n=1 Tax=Trichostrongylus colubriformis TaxID=6319 RepID=A0AAN8F2N6_TRICO